MSALTGSNEVTLRFDVSIDVEADRPITDADQEAIRQHIIDRLSGDTVGSVVLDAVAAS